MIVDMKKLTLVALKREMKLVLDALHYVGCIQIKQSDDVAGTEKMQDYSQYTAMCEEKLKTLLSCIEIVGDSEIERKRAAKKDESLQFEQQKKPFFFCRRDVSYDEFMLIAAQEIEINATVSDILALNSRRQQIRADIMRCQNKIAQLKPYAGVKIPYAEFAYTKNIVFGLGQMQVSNYATYIDKIANSDIMFSEIIDKTSITLVIGIAYRASDAESVETLLAESGYSGVNFDFECTPNEKIESMQIELLNLMAEDTNCVVKLSEYAQNLNDIKLLYDYYRVEYDKASSHCGLKCTDSTFVLEAWLPYNTTENVEETLLSKTQNLALFFSDPKEGDEVPTLTKNMKLVAPYESVTNLYSPPRYKESDPNIFVAIFFFLFFGLMLSDAGYGIFLTLVTLIIMKVFKLETPMKRMMLVICMGGISTLIWGAVLGTWFGVDVTDIPILGDIMWFNPIKEPLMLLIVCLLLGVVQIMFGMGVKAAQLIKQGKVFSAIFDIFSWYLFFIGVGIAVLPMVAPQLPAIMNTIGFCVAGSGLAIVFFTNGRAKKGIFGKIIGGFSGLYNVVNLLGDVLSYARLFGLGVATGIIGYAMNVLAGLLFGAWYTIPFGILVLIVGHLFNLAINVLGAYIHNSRLQFIEFFGKFYEGGGEDFKPIGVDTLYVKISNKNSPAASLNENTVAV